MQKTESLPSQIKASSQSILLPCETCGKKTLCQSYFADLDIYQCKECELIFYKERTIDVDHLYNSSYFHGEEYRDYLSEKESIQSNFSNRIKDLQKICPKDGKVFEIGCAYGFFLDLAQQHWSVSGIDVFKDGVKHAKEKLGLQVQEGDFLSLQLNANEYDAICMWDTIEHLPNPHGFLEKAFTLIKPGGHVVLTTGDIGSLVAKTRGQRWRMVHPPTHLYYFHRKNISNMLQKIGYTQIKIKYPGYSRRYKGMVWAILSFKKIKYARLIYNILTLGDRLDFPVYLNLFDIMMVTAQKPRAPSRTN